MGKLIKNHLARLIVLTAAVCMSPWLYKYNEKIILLILIK